MISSDQRHASNPVNAAHVPIEEHMNNTFPKFNLRFSVGWLLSLLFRNVFDEQI